MKVLPFIKKNLANFIAFTIALIVAAINFNLLLKPLNLVTGGSGGLALVLENVLPLSTSVLVTIIFVITFVLAVIFLDKKTVISVIYASIVYPLMVYLTEDITSIFTFTYQDIFLVCLVSGVISGITNGTVYKYGLSSGGLSVIPLIMNKYFKFSISTVNFVINTLVVLMGVYFYGFNLVLYAIILLYINSYICNTIILGSSKNKVMFIRSNSEEKVKKLLFDKYHINATILDSVNEDTLVVVVRNIDYLKIKRDLLSIDSKIFFITNDCYEVGR